MLPDPVIRIQDYGTTSQHGAPPWAHVSLQVRSLTTVRVQSEEEALAQYFIGEQVGGGGGVGEGGNGGLPAGGGADGVGLG